MENFDIYANVLATNAKKASATIRTLDNEKRSAVLYAVAKALRENKNELFKANRIDIENAKEHVSSAMLDRLTMTEERLETMAKGAEEIAAFKDPLNKILEHRTLPNGVDISRVSVPIGTVFFIYESRPNVTIDGASLCFKSGNAVILRGGKESANSAKFLANLFRETLKKFDIDENAVQLVDIADHALVSSLLQLNDSIDLVIPRGGERLIRAVTSQSKIPVIKHFNGICHIYCDKSANIQMATSIVYNAKTQRPSTCNALETLLIDSHLTDNQVDEILRPLRDKGVEMYGDAKTVSRLPYVHAFNGEFDYAHEYLSLAMSVKFVENVEMAAKHIEKYSSKHTESVIAEDKYVQEYFLNHVDSSSVMVNTSTRLADGGQYGLGAEVGISTDKLHARGPMGVESLCTYKWILKGFGQIRE